MFGHQDDQSQHDNQIPDQAIDAALGGDTPQETVTPTSAPPAPQSAPEPQAAPAAATPPAPATPVDNSLPVDGLIDIKQQALSQLSPLLGHLDQTPEEKFRTTMMMIQASDNQHLIKDAFEAAQAIPDEKVRAQALLDIVNEINYFTQQHDS